MLDFILKIPAMIEFIFSGIVFIIIKLAFGEALAETAKETVCTMPELMSKILCALLTNSVVGFISIFITVLALGAVFRSKFLSGS